VPRFAAYGNSADTYQQNRSQGDPEWHPGQESVQARRRGRSERLVGERPRPCDVALLKGKMRLFDQRRRDRFSQRPDKRLIGIA
jgi:hypothetical protein